MVTLHLSVQLSSEISNICFCIHSSVEGYLGSFQLLAIINRAAMKIVEHIPLLHVGESSGYMPRRGIAGSFGSDVPSFLRNRQTDFQSGCTNLQPHQQWRSVPLSPHPLQHLAIINRAAMNIVEHVSLYAQEWYSRIFWK